jgi:hypothetical protein
MISVIVMGGFMFALSGQALLIPGAMRAGNGLYKPE